MNHIHALQRDLQTEVATNLQREGRINEFREHLDLPKFAPVQLDGSRGDWMSVADIRRWLTYIESK